VNDNDQPVHSGHPNPEEFREWVGKFLLGGHTVKENSDLTDENVEALYALAHGEYNGGRFEQAQRLFGLLCTIDHMQKKYWMGLGASCQMNKSYRGAVEAYAIAGVFAFDDPDPRMYAADCYLQMGDRRAAADGFRYVVRCTVDRPEYAEVRQQAEARLAMLSSRSAETTT